MLSRVALLCLCVGLLCVLTTGCDSSSSVDAAVDAAMDGGVDASGGPYACTRQSQCAPLRCVAGRVAEVLFEPGEVGECLAADRAIGGGPPRWSFRPGGKPLADRLCTAQGLWPGAGASDRRRQLLREAGVSVVRLDFGWHLLEPERGVLDFDAHDAMVAAAEAEGIEVLGILAYGVPWASSATDDDRFYPPDDPADFARFAAEVSAHYAGRIRRWEIWNEQNAGYRFFKPNVNGDAAAYASLLSSAASAIHDACTDCVVVSGGLFFHEQLINGAIEFTHDMLTADPHALDGVDVFGFHPYPSYPPSDPPELDGEGARSIGAMVDDLRAVLALHEVGELPFAATELGWPSYGAIDEDEQALLLSRAMLLGAALDLDPVCWFNVTDGPSHGLFPPEDDFGLYRFGSEDASLPIDPKPSRDAFRWLARIGEGAVFTGVVDDPALHAPDEGRFALDFERPEGAWRVLFALAPYDAELGETREARDPLGAVVAPPADDRWTIGEAPLFFVPPGI